MNRPDPIAGTDDFSDLFIGNGELATHMRDLDWEKTSLGSPRAWPQSLRTTVRTLLTSRYQMWMGWGKELFFLYNDAYRPTLGVKHPWAVGRPASEVWREIWNDVGPLVQHVMTTGEATYNEGMLLILERSGFPEETYHTFSYSPLFDDDGAVAGLLCVVVEETDRIISTRRLATLRNVAAATAGANDRTQLFRAVKAQLSQNLHDLPFALLYMFDEDSDRATLAAASGIQAGHSAAPAVLGQDAQLWAASQIREGAAFVLIDDLPQQFGALPGGAWNRSPRQAVVVPIAQQGSNRPAGFLVAAVNPYRRSNIAYRDFVGLLANQIAGALANVQGFEQERKRAEALAEIDRAKTTFFSNVSHEFRTPLTLMLGPLEELLSPNSQAGVETRAQVQLAHRNGMRLLRLVNSLLDFSRIEAGRINAEYESTDLATFSTEIAATFRSAVEKAGLTLTVQATALPQSVHVDRDMWEKILLNLLSNAFKFTLKGGITLSIGASSDGRRAEVRVADTGIGIAETDLPRLFERFYRVEGAQGRSIEGSGIGLALVQELIKLHGGSTEVISSKGQGTTFTVSIPFGTAHLAEERIRSAATGRPVVKAQPFIEEALRWLPELSQSVSAAAEFGAAHNGHGKRVLLADDNADMREYVSRLLMAQGYHVVTAEDGEAALARARSERFDLILTDVMMPRLDGFGLLRAIRLDARLASTPVIMLSARAAEEATVEGIEAGADDYLTKPFAARELLARVRTNIELSATRHEATRAILFSEQRVQLSQERLTRALSSGRVAVYEWDLADRLSIYGPLAQAFGVVPEQAAQGLPLQAFVAGIHPDDRERTLAAVQHTVDTGEPLEVQYRLQGEYAERTVLSRGQIESHNDRRIFTGILIDLTQELRVEQRLREQTRALGILNRTATMVAGEVDTDKVVQAITDAGVELTGAQFGAFFYNVQDGKGDRYTLYTLSGAAPEAFAKFPMPRKTAVFGPTFEGRAIIRSDDITRDARYGLSEPHRGMPPGHLPVRSYLAAPVKSPTGEVLGGLFFGHAQAGIFAAEHEDLVAGLAANAAVAMDNARLVQKVQLELEQRRRAESELQALNSTLEQRVLDEVAERTRAEDALRHAQKMEAIGQLTGGVAHDFNNLLTVIIGGLETVQRVGTADQPRLKRATDMALQGAQRAAQLTARLLAFSRRQPLDPKPLDLNAMVRDMTELLHRTLGETIELEDNLTSRLWRVELDQNQLEIAIINLAVNARDAMTEGGRLIIETANTVLDAGSIVSDSNIVAGEYVLLTVSDTGAGMSREIMARVFEPFFTTKEVGRGTGLGLSMVYGFARQSGGHVTIDSDIGRGTSVKLYFPRFMGEMDTQDTETAPDIAAASRNEVVLVVEDNPEVRAYSVMMLGELGYEVLEAGDAPSAMAIIGGTARIDLLFTDVVLPGKTGRALADEARTRRPGLRVLYTTGYSRDAIMHDGRLDAGVQLINKPFTFDQLSARVREVLDDVE